MILRLRIMSDYGCLNGFSHACPDGLVDIANVFVFYF